MEIKGTKKNIETMAYKILRQWHFFGQFTKLEKKNQLANSPQPVSFGSATFLDA